MSAGATTVPAVIKERLYAHPPVRRGQTITATLTPEALAAQQPTVFSRLQSLPGNVNPGNVTDTQLNSVGLARNPDGTIYVAAGDTSSSGGGGGIGSTIAGAAGDAATGAGAAIDFATNPAGAIAGGVSDALTGVFNGIVKSAPTWLLTGVLVIAGASLAVYGLIKAAGQEQTARKLAGRAAMVGAIA